MKTMDWCGLANALLRLCNRNGLVIEAAMVCMSHLREVPEDEE